MVQLDQDARPSHRRLPRDRSRRHASRSLAVALVALAVATLSAIPKSLSDAELALFEAANTLPDALEWPLWTVMQLGALLAVPATAILAFIIWRRLRPSLDLLVAGTLAWLLARPMKELLGRGRPASFLDDVELRGSVGIADEGLGFPSGHAAVAFALAVVVFPYLSARWRIVTIVLAATVAFARLYVGVHFPLDVLGGLALGIAIAASVHLVMDLLTHHH